MLKRNSERQDTELLKYKGFQANMRLKNANFGGSAQNPQLHFLPTLLHSISLVVGCRCPNSIPVLVPAVSEVHFHSQKI